MPTPISYLSSITTLTTVDLIFTGTPDGVGAAQAKFRSDGDIINIAIADRDPGIRVGALGASRFLRGSLMTIRRGGKTFRTAHWSLVSRQTFRGQTANGRSN
ncbi:MAG: hypothetical protein ACI9DE_000771 [Halioglobus sp.]